MSSPSICGGFLRDKRSMVAFTWSITTVLTIFAFITAIILSIQTHSHYRRMERYYESDDWYQQYLNDDYSDDQGDEDEGGGSRDQSEQYRDQQEAYLMLSTVSAKSMTFVAVYTMMMATALSLYGSTAIVGFTSLRGVYIAPCFSSSGSNKMRVGIFGGATVIFANLLLVCAVILGEVRVEDYRGDGGEDEGGDSSEMEPYQVERIATVLAVTCMFLSALYTIFAVLLFLCYTSEEILSGGSVSDVANSHAKTPLVSGAGVMVTSDQRQLDSPDFITMENSSQGTA